MIIYALDVTVRRFLLEALVLGLKFMVQLNFDIKTTFGVKNNHYDYNQMWPNYKIV